jgi:hypothetical protein
MTLRRASCQSAGTVEAFYQRLAESTHDDTAVLGRAMVTFLAHLAPLFEGRDIWGLTSHYHLVLLAEDDYRSAWLVRVIAQPGLGYEIRYRWSDGDAPWNEAQVSGFAATVEDAVRMVGVAMTRSRGWSGPV